MKKRTMEGYTWENWSKYFCKSWSGNHSEYSRKIHCPEIFTSKRQMSSKNKVKVRITIEQIKDSK